MVFGALDSLVSVVEQNSYLSACFNPLHTKDPSTQLPRGVGKNLAFSSCVLEQASLFYCLVPSLKRQ